MADKSKLLQGLAQPATKPAIRRGQGVRLSTDEAPAQADQIDAPATLPQVSATSSAEDVAGEIDQAEQHHPPTDPQPTQTRQAEQSERISRGYKLDETLIIACRMVASASKRHLCDVMEEALREYLQHHAADILDVLDHRQKGQIGKA